MDSKPRGLSPSAVPFVPPMAGGTPTLAGWAQPPPLAWLVPTLPGPEHGSVSGSRTLGAHTVSGGLQARQAPSREPQSREGREGGYDDGFEPETPNPTPFFYTWTQ